MSELRKGLGMLDAASIIIGTVIGAGIFLVPSLVARQLPSAGSIVLVWVVCGALTLFGALAYAELGAMMPATGGQYIFLREAYGPLLAFLFGWTSFLIIIPAQLGALAVGFSIYLSYLLPLNAVSAKVSSILLIALLSWTNYRGVRSGAITQNVFTFLKLGGILILIAGAFLSRTPSQLDWAMSPGTISWAQWGAAALACLLAYDGWNLVSYTAGEMKDPRRDLPRAIALGISVIICAYVFINIAVLRMLPVPEAATTDRVASVAAMRALGSIGASIVTVTILLSIVGSTNGGMLSVPRVYFAQARDGLFFASLGKVHPRFQTPHVSIAVQGVLSIAAAMTGSYARLITYAILTGWIFYALTVAAVPILRMREPGRDRPYRMWGYPVTPLLFVITAVAFVLRTMVSEPGSSAIGILLICSGIPVFAYWKRNLSRSRAAVAPTVS
jgi:APA family basic amino acid/polyamine antiporter